MIDYAKRLCISLPLFQRKMPSVTNYSVCLLLLSMIIIIIFDYKDYPAYLATFIIMTIDQCDGRQQLSLPII